MIATGFGSGYSPVAPGTAGALVGCLILALLWWVFPVQLSGGWGQVYWLLLPIGTFFLLGTIAADKMEQSWGHDPSKVVVDEIVGVWVAMLGVPFSWLNLALAFGLFRLFDIWKPLGIRRLEKLKGGWGVMADDVAAGAVACAILHFFLYMRTA